MEIVNGASRTGMSIRDWLIKARESGLNSIPGTAAEILDDDVRWVRLDVQEVSAGGFLDTSGQVEFAAHYRRDGVRGVQRERSEFVREGGRWLYVGPVAAD